MYHHRKDPEAFRSGVRELVGSLDASQFKALSLGVGLGQLQARREPLDSLKQQRVATPTPQPMMTTAPTVTASSPRQVVHQMSESLPPPQQPVVGRGATERIAVASVVAVPQQQPVINSTARRPRHGGSWGRRILALGFDFCVVAASGVLLLMALFVLLLGEFDVSRVLLFVRELYVHGHLLPALGVVSAVMLGLYLTYWLVFRMVAGMTLGHFVFGQGATSEVTDTPTPLHHS